MIHLANAYIVLSGRFNNRCDIHVQFEIVYKQVYSDILFTQHMYTPPSKSLASLETQAACQSIDTHFGILTVHDNHKLELFCHHKLLDVHELYI